MFASHAGATILTFDNLGLSNYGAIPGSYGDNVSALSDATGSYGQGNGFTPNVTVEYRTWRISTNTVDYNYLDYWDNNYGDLQNVAFPAFSTDGFGEISLIAENGWNVMLNSFDIAGWPSRTTSNTIRILDGYGTVLYNNDNAEILGASGLHSNYAFGLSAPVLRIQYAFNDWNVGIDNVNFDQKAVPLPAAAYLFGTGLAGLIAARRKRNT